MSRNEITTKEASRLLGVSTRTIFTYIKEGKLTPRKERNKTLLLLDEVESIRKEASQRFSIDPLKHIVLEQEKYEGMLIRLAQLEERNRFLTSQLDTQTKLLEDRRPWWKRFLR
jgi:excisionase family DNA binding protein